MLTRLVFTLACVGALLTASPLLAQSALESPQRLRERRYLVGDQADVTGLYIGLPIEMLPVLGRPVRGGGISTGITLNDQWLVGVYWQGMGTGAEVRPSEPTALGSASATLYQTEFGLEAARWFRPERAVHPVVQARLGWGNARWWGRDVPSSDMWTITPMVGIQANVTYWARLELLAGYRAALGLNLPGLSPDALNGPLVSLQLRFGIFDRSGQDRLNELDWIDLD